MILFSIILLLSYTLLIGYLSIGFKKAPTFIFQKTKPITKFSILIPFRNEEENLPHLLKSILHLKYDSNLFEIIFIDDDSSDNSVSIINNFIKENLFKSSTIRILKNKRLSNSPKKDAITTGINQSKYNWIVTTDADCILPKKWLLSFNSFIQQNQPNMVVAPVTYQVNNSFLEHFQLLDFLSMQGATIGGFGINFPFMSNGANLAYRKDLFFKLDGFSNNNHIASGDDIFLFEKFLNYHKKQVQFLKSPLSIVTTFPTKSWKELLHQRTRWASKTTHFKSIGVKGIGLLIFLVNLSIVITFFIGISTNFSILYFLSIFIIKVLVDFFLFTKTAVFFNQRKTFYQSYIQSSILYPFYTSFVVIYALFFKFKWKERSFKQ